MLQHIVVWTEIIHGWTGTQGIISGSEVNTRACELSYCFGLYRFPLHNINCSLRGGIRRRRPTILIHSTGRRQCMVSRPKLQSTTRLLWKRNAPLSLCLAEAAPLNRLDTSHDTKKAPIIHLLHGASLWQLF